MRFLLAGHFQTNSIVFLLILVCKLRYHTSLNIWNAISTEQPKVNPNELRSELVLCVMRVLRLLISGNKDLHLIAGQNCCEKFQHAVCGTKQTFSQRACRQQTWAFAPFRVWIFCCRGAARKEEVESFFVCVAAAAFSALGFRLQPFIWLGKTQQ